MTLLTDQDGGGGCDSTKREEILHRLTVLESTPHCPDHEGLSTKLDTLDGKVGTLTTVNVIALVMGFLGIILGIIIKL
ncbi:MAG: hypothetical protein PHE17_19200 [Thiothrix sp.]|jgi:hypothetical protein|uniref:hypothetical protein n=1 Tax=Thiothrix sp. TaxID=1032 RepID=UPI00261A8CEA|nr:hypothetical protein [Thiothrix sp.]MDD5395154.1 hypothetical protein [Thiothrix sp.]